MPRNGTGTYTLPAGNPVVSGTSISSTATNNTNNDIASALTASISQDGQTPITANLRMDTFLHTNVGAATALTNYARTDQVQNQSFCWCGTAGGTANALTVTATPSPTAYVAGQVFRFKAGASPNSGATTIAVSGLAAIAVQKSGAACTGSEILANQWYEVMVDASTTSCQLSPVTGWAASGANSDITSLSGLTTAALGDNSTSPATTAFVRSNGRSPLQPITASVGSNALTLTLNPTVLDFRSATIGSGTVTTLAVSAAISVVVPSSATLGTINATAARLVVIAINNAGTVELAVVNIAGGNDLTETGVISTTTISAGATANNVIYSTTGRASVAYRVVGYVDITEATAGTWATAPSTIQGIGGRALQSLPIQNCKAWVNFDGTLSGTITPRASYNVSSVTKNGTGDYTINFTTAMADANYVPVGASLEYSASAPNNTTAMLIKGELATGATTKTTTALRVVYASVTSVQLYDPKEFYCAILGN